MTDQHASAGGPGAPRPSPADNGLDDETPLLPEEEDVVESDAEDGHHPGS